MAWGQRFGYDVFGNLLSIDVTQGSATSLSVGVNSKNQITNSGFSCDASGNMLNDGTGFGAHSDAYDADNRITKVDNGTTAKYLYDRDGKRVGTTAGTIYWYGAGGDPLVETSLTGGSAVEYIFFGGIRIARRDSSGNVDYYFTDHLGSSRVITNSAGTTLDDCDFGPFGVQAYCGASSSGNHYLFTGKKWDSETGNDYFDARYYESNLGRMMSPDPMGGHLTDPQTLNRYAYALNNPTTLTDPSGLCPNCHPITDPATCDNITCSTPGGLPVGFDAGGGWTSLTLADMASTPTAIGFAYPVGGEQVILAGFLYLIYGNTDLANLAFLLTGQPQTQLVTDSGSSTITAKAGPSTRCSGTARALAGNPNLIGRQGGIPGTAVTAGSTAAIPSQWGGIRPLTLLGDQIFGAVAVPSLHGLVAFSGVTDTIGSRVVPNVQQVLQNRFPGSLILELNNLPASADSGVPTFATVSVPQPMGCPAGTGGF